MTKIQDYSMHPATIASRRCYHKKTKSQKKKIYKRQAKIKKANVAAGKCRICGRKREREDITVCDKCNVTSAKRIKEYKINNALDGRCSKCPNPADGLSSHCIQCKEKARLAMRKRRAKCIS